ARSLPRSPYSSPLCAGCRSSARVRRTASPRKTILDDGDVGLDDAEHFELLVSVAGDVLERFLHVKQVVVLDDLDRPALGDEQVNDDCEQHREAERCNIVDSVKQLFEIRERHDALRTKGTMQRALTPGEWLELEIYTAVRKFLHDGHSEDELRTVAATK